MVDNLVFQKQPLVYPITEFSVKKPHCFESLMTCPIFLEMLMSTNFCNFFISLDKNNFLFLKKQFPISFEKPQWNVL